MIYIYILIKIALLSTKVIFSTNLWNLTAVKTNRIITGVELPYTKAKEKKAIPNNGVTTKNSEEES